jgi:hypothetical protein
MQNSKYLTSAEAARLAGVPQSALHRAIHSGAVVPSASAGRFKLFEPGRVGEIQKQFSREQVRDAFLKTLDQQPELAAEVRKMDPRERARLWRHYVTRGSSAPFKSLAEFDAELAAIQCPHERAKHFRENIRPNL